MDFAIHECKLPKRSESLDEYVDLLYHEYEFHPQVYNRVIKYTFLVLLNIITTNDYCYSQKLQT